MTSAFLFPRSDSGRRRPDGRDGPPFGGRRLRSPRHALERQLRLLPQRRAQPGARSGHRALRHHRRRAGHRLRGLPRPGRRARGPQRAIRCPPGPPVGDGGRRPDHRQPVAPVAGTGRRSLRALPRPAAGRRRRAVPGARRSLRPRRRSGDRERAAVARHAAAAAIGPRSRRASGTTARRASPPTSTRACCSRPARCGGR